MADHTVKIVVQVDSGAAVTALGNVSKGMTGVAQAAKTSSTASVASGVAMGVMMADVAEKALSMAQKVVTGFTDMASEVYRMQIVMGGTAQDMSRLKFASEMVGVSTEDLTRAFMFASNHLAVNDKAAQALGVSYVDLSGHVKPTMQVFGEMADKLNAVQDPFQRANMARDIFGRGVRAMEPLLALGSKGLKDLGDKANELGVVLDGKDVQAARNFHASLTTMKASLQGVGNEVGRALVPVLSTLAQSVAKIIVGLKTLWDRFAAVRAIVVLVGTVIAVAGAAILFLAASTKIAAAAMAIFDAAMDANPIMLIILAVIGLIAGLIALVKNFKVVGDGIRLVTEGIGYYFGGMAFMALQAVKAIIDVMSELLDKGLMVVGWFADIADFVGGLFGGSDHSMKDAVDSVRNGLKDITGTIDKSMTDWSHKAWTTGGDIGRKLGEGMVSAIKNLHMPKMSELVPALVDPSGAPMADQTSSGGAGKKAVDARKQAILDFFTQLVKQSYTALEALRTAAKDAKQKMLDMGKSIADSLNEAFSLSAVSGATFAGYTGPGALIRGFERRLQAMKDFISDIRSLSRMGLPKEMLADLVTAGVSGGARTAHMLVGHPEVMAQLQGLQNEINTQTAAAGAYVSQTMLGGQADAAEQAAISGQSQYRGYLGAAQQVGYVPTADELSAASANIHNELTINATTQADPQQIADAVAWALQTWSTLPTGSGGGGKKVPTKALPPKHATPNNVGAGWS